MATRKFLFVDANGDYQESAGAYETADFVASSAGGADAGKPIKLDGSGLLDETLFDFASVFTIDGADAKVFKASDIASTTAGKGAAIVGVEDSAAYYSATNLESVLAEIKTQLGGTTSTSYNFSENNVLADNDAVYAALNKLDLKFGDIASTSVGEGASLVGINDAGNYFTATTVEAALQELAAEDDGASYTVATGGVTKGDLVYISANNSVAPYATLSAAHFGIGLARSTEAAASSVIVMRNDAILTGLLSGATAGARYYWDGSTHVTSIPSGAGQHVWQTGVAKNATDLHVEIRPIRVNA
jgi:hypothetical protein